MALEYLLPCKCGKKTPVSESLAGTYITCDCGRSVQVPKRNRLFELEPAPAKAVVTAIPVPPTDRDLPMPPIPAPVITKESSCSECGAALQPKANFCWLCGKPTGSQTTPIGASYTPSPATSNVASGCLAAVVAFFAGLAVAAALVYAMLASMAQQCSRMLGGGH